jgi:hypothetical protein
MHFCCTAAKQQCHYPVSNPGKHACLTIVTQYYLIPILGGLNLKSATFAVLFPTYTNTCSDHYVVRLLTLIIVSAVWSTDSNVLHLVLNGDFDITEVIIRADMQILINGPIA